MVHTMVHISSYLKDYLEQLQLRIDTMPEAVASKHGELNGAQSYLFTEDRMGSELCSDTAAQCQQAIAQCAIASHHRSSTRVWVVADETPLGSWGAHFISVQSRIPIERLLSNPIFEADLPLITEAIEALRQSDIWLSHHRLSCQSLLACIRDARTAGHMISVVLMSSSMLIDTKQSSQISLFQDDADPDIDHSELPFRLTVDTECLKLFIDRDVQATHLTSASLKQS